MRSFQFRTGRKVLDAVSIRQPVRVVVVLLIVILGSATVILFRIGDRAAIADPHAGSLGVVLPIDDTIPGCEQCTLTFEPLQSYGEITDSELLRGMPRYAQNASGQVWAWVPDIYGQLPLVYGPGGSRALGQIGEGPGEFRRVHGLAFGPHDTIYVAHDLNRISVFDSTARLIRTEVTQIRLTGGLVPLQNGLIVAAGGAHTRDLADIPIHLIDGNGRVRRSFGYPSIFVRVGMPDFVVAPAHDSNIWAAEPLNYRLQLLDSAGSAIKTILVSPPESWESGSFLTLRQWDSVRSRMPRVNVNSLMASRPGTMPVSPPVRVSGIFDDGYGRVWVSLQVPGINWADVEITTIQSPEGGVRVDAATQLLLYRTAVDIIDHQNGVLLSRTYLEGIGQVLSDSTIARVEVRPNGLIRTEILRMLHSW